MRVALLIVALAFMPVVAAAQRGVKPTTPQAPAPPGPQASPQGEAYTYQVDGRRDPFLNLLGTGADSKLPLSRAEGAEGYAVLEITVRGIMYSKGTYIAMIQGPDGKNYAVRQGDKLADGVIRAVNAEGLVVVQQVNDPLSLVKQRELSRKLRSLEAKE